MQGTSDIDLMLSLKKGDRRVMSALVERYEKPLVNFLFRMIGNADEAEDLFQETFLRVLRAAKTYEPKAAFSTWLYTIARNLCLDRLKKIRGLPMVSLEGGSNDQVCMRDALPSNVRDPCQAAATAEMARAVRGALMMLPPKKREVLVLRVYQGLPYDEIARVVNAPLGTVKYRIHDAMKSLSDIMHDALPDS